MKTIKLYGDLQRFKQEWSLNVKTVAESMRAIEANRPGFIGYADQGDYVLVLVDHDNPNASRQVTQNTALEAWAHEELWVIPRVSGNTGVETVIAIGATAGVAIGATTAAVIAGLINIAIAVAISVIAKVISGTNSGVRPEETEPYESKPSYLMNGVVNTTRQGHRIPLLYGGPLLVGSMVLSADIHTKDIPA